MNNKKILITGINGFVGRKFLNFLYEKNPKSEVYGILRSFKKTENFIQVICDLTDKEKVRSILREISPDYIFHFAGKAYVNDWETLFSSNVCSTLNLLDSLKELELSPKFIIIGSASEYGVIEKLPVNETAMPSPTSLYGASMCCRTNIALMYKNMGFDVTIGRVFNTSGFGVTYQTPIGSFAKQIAAIENGLSEPIVYTGNLTPLRDFIDIDDVVKAFYCLATKSTNCGIYNICSGKPVSIETILNTYKELSSKKFNVITSPSLVRINDIKIIYGDNTKIKTETGWTPEIELYDSLKKTLDFYKKSV